LLGRWGILDHCEGLATALHILASLIAFACLAGAYFATTHEASPDTR
jgi:hypothetical protein